MAYELFTLDGKRKYLNADELDLFITAAGQQERPDVRTLCLVLAHTGCRNGNRDLLAGQKKGAA